jgi:prepilin-type N-terminal cleavage/methylation domain-containing protein
MLARIRKARENEGGFTLIELLVVMIIIGILAAIAIPVFLSQRAKARDTSTKADVSTIGKEVATFYVDGTGPLTLAPGTAANTVDIKSGATIVTTVRTSNGTALQATSYKATAGTEDSTWCVALTNPAGSQKNYFYSAAAGLNEGSCP